MALQSTGKIISAGYGTYNNSISFLIIRYNENGSIDSSFGNEGVTGNFNDLNQVNGLAIQKDDAIIAVGHTSDVKLVRYKKDGTLDSSFGNEGIVITNVGAEDVPADVAIQPDGKIVVCGYIINDANEARQLFLVRYLDNGSLDGSFGENGIVILGETNGDKSLSTVNALALQPNGQILICAYLVKGAIYRFNIDGSVDKTFGINGLAYFQAKDNLVKNFQAYDIVVQSDNKIVGGGTSPKSDNSGNNYMAAGRLNADGSIDSSFGNNGLQHVLFGNNPSEGRSILLEKEGKLIVSGTTHDDTYTYSNLALTRFNSMGFIDSTFGNNGQTETEAGGSASGKSSVLQNDGKILLGGTLNTGAIGGNNYFLLARYNNNNDTKKQIIITKIRHWIQHHNGIEWYNMPDIQSYAVQRSTDGQHWVTISNQAAVSGQQFAVNHYSDPTPSSNETTYYRLHTTSTSNAVANSNVIAISNDDDIKVSPILHKAYCI